MPQWIWFSMLAVLVGACGGKWRYTDHVKLPSGYEHQGVKTVFVRVSDPQNYNSKLALAAFKEEVRERTNLFRLVEHPADAELVMLVTPVAATVQTTRRSWKFGRPLDTAEESATKLLLVITEREHGEIYEQSFTVGRHPNTGTRPAAHKLIHLYASGR